MAERALITIRVHPGASRARIVGLPPGPAEPSGPPGPGEPPGLPGQERVLEVWVTQRAVDGKATEAALGAVADALGVRRRSVRLVTGARSRVKLIEVTDPPAGLAGRLASWSD